MKCVIQRVKHAKCEIDGKITGEIEVGYMILVGFKPEDNELIVDKMVKKIVNLRIFEDENQKMNLNIKQVNGKVLSVSQFTLYANTNEGNRPSFANAMKPNQATILYDSFNHKLRSEGIETETGIFGADMQITLTNDGPVTIILEF